MILTGQPANDYCFVDGCQTYMHNFEMGEMGPQLSLSLRVQLLTSDVRTYGLIAAANITSPRDF